jgi:hypothetical protein
VRTVHLEISWLHPRDGTRDDHEFHHFWTLKRVIEYGYEVKEYTDEYHWIGKSQKQSNASNSFWGELESTVFLFHSVWMCLSGEADKQHIYVYIDEIS